MNLAILHFHLNPGGVTRVIENHLLATDAAAPQPVRVAILHGGQAAGWCGNSLNRLTKVAVSLHVVPELQYDDDGRSSSPASLAASIRETLVALGFRQDETVLHVHNATLGKNLALPAALRRLADDGWRLLLQIHDFAEDFRPANYRRMAAAYGASCPAVLYPQAAQIHYAVLNRRDWDVLTAAGIADDRLHRLPNPVPAPGVSPNRLTARRRLERQFGFGPEQRYVFYPVRGIRRKNIGEAVLLSLLDRRESEEAPVYGIALAPLNPREKPYYDRWRRLADELKAPLRFAAGESSEGGVPFAENLAAADAAVTTSVAEGFGMTFLEPCLVNLPLRGRGLPEITCDFIASGMSFPGLYERLAVPIEWVGADDFADAFRTAGESLLTAYGLPELPMRIWLAAFDQKIAGGTVDFGDLDESLQERVLRRIAGDGLSRDELRSLNPAIAAVDDEAAVASNAECVHRAFAPGAIGRQLIGIHQRLLETHLGSVASLDSAGVILERFLDLRRFRLIRGVT